MSLPEEMKVWPWQYFEGVDKIGVEAYNNAGESLTWAWDHRQQHFCRERFAQHAPAHCKCRLLPHC